MFLLLAVLGGCVFGLSQVFSGSLIPERVAPVTPPPAADSPKEGTPPEAIRTVIPDPAHDSQEPAGKTAAGPASVTQPPALQASSPAPDQDPPREAPESPLEDFSLEKAATALSSLVPDGGPKVWGENLSGVTIRLSREQVRKAREVAPILAHGAGREDDEGDAFRPVLALTLDLCGGKPGSSYDERIIRLLRERGIPATIFVSSLWMHANKEALADLAEDPLFEVAAHGAKHKPCSVNGRSAYGITGTASLRELVFEIEGNARDLAAATGRRPLWFRSGTAHYDEVAIQVLQELVLGIAGYSVAVDQGATLPSGAVAARLLDAKSGDILLAHLNKPESGTYEGLAQALPELLRKGTIFIQLSFGG